MKNPFAKDGRQIGDRRDGKLIRDLDSLHYITGIIYPNRCDNEAFISETIDLTAINEYLKKKNCEGIEYKYNLFQIINAGIIKMLTLRPKMNRFIANDNFYQRNEVSTAFVVKKLFADNGAEALAFVHATDDDTIDTIHEKIYKQVSSCRSDKADSTTESMDVFNKIPRFVSKAAIHGVMWLDKHGWVPAGLIETDPYYSSCVISNLGSIKMKSGYHHLTNWGSCSMITLIGEIKDKPVLKEDGTTEVKPCVDIGITIDERLADGYYYAKSIRLFRKLMANPELLERPMSEAVEF
ncbi:MAG: 2-oxo acid dehydrogenase subunit E2 [Clostridiales bacterium]|nr:2-oxo acid dehydrogenase subunit E2 [Candidatus Crickella caballi]